MAAVDPDAARLRELGYEQELDRRLGGLGNVAMGFATTSPVVGLYAVVFLGSLLAGPAWIWVLPVALAGQCLLLVVYSELSAEFPITGGAYQWTRRLMGGGYGWFTGWVAMCAYAAANTTIAYLGAPWALTLLEIEPTANTLVLTGMILVVVCALVGMGGIGVLRRVVGAGVAAEVIALVGIGLVLLLAFREQDLSVLGETFGAEALSGGSVGAALLAALAVGGWVFIGFDACVGSAEETRGAARQVPRSVWLVLLSVAAIVLLNALASVLAHPDPRAVVSGRGHRSRHDRGGQLIRLLVHQAVRRARSRGLRLVRDRGAGAHGADDVLDRPRRCAARARDSCAASIGAAPRSAGSWSRRCSPVPACCWRSTPPPSAASSSSAPRRSTSRSCSSRWPRSWPA